MKRILVISPHLDDAELGAGGTIAKLIGEGNEVQYLGFSAPFEVDFTIARNQCIQATKHLGILDFERDVRTLNYATRNFDLYRQEILDMLIGYKKTFNPNIVFTTSSKDFHQDHKVVHEETVRAFRSTAIILGYDFPWDYTDFSTNYFVRISEIDLIRKLNSVASYINESKRCKAMNPDIIRSLAKIRGSQCNADYAEAFEFIRGVV